MIPSKTQAQDKTLTNLLAGSSRHMTWWISPAQEQVSAIYVLVDAGHFKIDPDGECNPVGEGEYQAAWSRAFRAGLGIFDEFHRLSKKDFEKLKDE